MRKPDFFIVGAPKCGTTALHTYLGEHPNVFVCTPKEPNYFATDFPTQRYVRNHDAYLGLYRAATPRHTVIGEASAWYLYSGEAIANIRKFEPNARIIAMVRNPVDMLPSLHRMLMFNFAEDVEDLETAWDLQDARRAGHSLPRNRNRRFDVSTLQYSQVCQLGCQIQRLKSVFHDDQVLIIPFDDFTADTQAVYNQVLQFLQLPPDGRTSFPAINVRRDFRSRRLAWLAWRARDLGSSVKRRMGITRAFAVKDFLNRFNERPESRPQLREAFRARLSDAFRDDVALLGELINRDLSHWLGPAPGTASGAPRPGDPGEMA